MRLLALPVSGGGFPTQLAALQHLCTIQYIPDLTLASSGGNVAAYIAAAAGWHWAGIERVARQLSQNLFVTPWSSISLVGFIIGFFEGNLYNRGCGVAGFLQQYFTSSSIVEHEIWTGTYNPTNQQARLFCNRAQANTIVNQDFIDHELTQTMTTIFADGDIELIAKAGLASASIPSLVPPQIIDDNKYQDGGMAGASPLAIMRGPILARIRQTGEPLHITYVNSVDLNLPQKMTTHNVVDALLQATSDLVRSATVADRWAGFQLLDKQHGTIHKETFLCNYDNLIRIKRLQELVHYSLLEIYPTVEHNLNISKFSGDDVAHNIRQAYDELSCRLWWVEPDVPHPEVRELLDICVGKVECQDRS